jgi:hypothetical protein
MKFGTPVEPITLITVNLYIFLSGAELYKFQGVKNDENLIHQVVLNW